MINAVIFGLACEVHWSWEELVNMPLPELMIFHELLLKKREAERKANEEAQAKARASRSKTSMKKPPSRGGRFRRR